ncbi:MAG: metalloprotease TldD [Hydrogenophilales bacterium 16-61-112]|nr:MAG: metalloprotease TldD [Hydrogenophilales bacterium 16-61-112]
MNPVDAFVPIQTAEQLFQSAEATLLTPNGLDADKLAPVFSRLMSHDVDYADLYFQYSRSEGWSLEEGQVKSGSFNIDQGVGVRAISGEKTAFAYSDDISLDALGAAADATRAIARAGQQRQTAVSRRGDSRLLYNPVDPLASLQDADKVALLERLEKKARAMDPRVIQVMASLASEYEVIFVARSDGHLAADVRPLVRLSLQVISEQDGRREQGSGGGGGRFDYSYFTDDILDIYARQAVHQASVNLDARPAPAGSMTVVLGSGWPGILLHEAIGHGLEGDDEGNPTQRTTLIEDGILTGYMQDMMNARLMGMGITGNARRESYAHLTMPRMTNTLMLGGDKDPAEIIASVKNGLYAVNFGGGQVDITSGKFVFSAAEAYMIEDGKITYPVKGATLIGNGPEVLTRVSMIGNDMEMDSGVGTCGKEGQSVPVGVGQPTLRIDGLTVGGTA